MNSSFNLKLRTPKGTLSLENISSQSSLSELKLKISKLTYIPTSSLIIKIGYPPKNIAQSPETTILKTFDITSSDLLIIEENPNASKPAPMKESLIKDLKPNIPNLDSIALEQTPNKDGLIMIRRIIPADNSCLFSAIAYNLNPKSRTSTEEYRHIVASYIRSEPKNYEGLLERPPEVYADWIMKDTSWGGEIELSILAKHFEVEIVAINIKNCQKLLYGNGKNRIFLLYDGIHYDSVVRNICEEILENDQTLFDKGDECALNGCLVLANQLRKKRQFTDLSKFNIQCQVCFEGLIGEKEALEHSKKTGHFNFREVDKI